MRQQHQTIFNGNTGDCFSTCIANILDMDVAAVPNFCAYEDWWERTQDWLAGLNLFFCEIESGENGLPPLPPLADGSLCVAAGMGPRGVRHAVVCKYKRDKTKKEHWLTLEHDPHPRSYGVKKIDIVGWLMVIDPSKPTGKIVTETQQG